MTGTSSGARPRVIALVGSTAVGKTAVADGLAVAVDGEIVSADSMQVYRGMDIGTAKPPPSARRAPYHIIDVAEPGEPFSAALYQRLARDAIAGIASRGRAPIMCGGTGLYVRAALDDMHFPAGEQVSATRKDIEVVAREIGPEALHARLKTIDPDSAALIHPHNVRRTIRALEMADDGISYAVQAASFATRDPYYDTTYVGLTIQREKLYARIDARVDGMMAAGLLDEVRGLLDAGFRDALTAQQAIGYKELVPVVEGEASVDKAVASVKQASRRYAKRQLTWFRADPRVRWLDVTDLSTADAVSGVQELLESDEPRQPGAR